MENDVLTLEQQAVLNESARVVEAGPGSGKTRALVCRFITRATSSARGIALLSFTNAAVDEARRRCGSAPGVLKPPHFVGTFDSFLHRFIVTPAEVARLGRAPSYLASWDELPSTMRSVRLKSVPGTGVPLSCFSIDSDGCASLNSSTLAWDEKAWLQQVKAAGREKELTDRAGSLIVGLINKGTLDSMSARMKAYDALSGEDGDAIVDRLSARFEEVLVDEAQDCDAAEIALIQRLDEAGVLTLAVADPDQAIFEFRGSNPSIFLNYRDGFDEASRVQLETCHRSTQEVCHAVSSLRCACTGDVCASDGGDCCPIYVISGSPQSQREKFIEILDQVEIPRGDAIVLAHSEVDAVKVAGGEPRQRLPRTAGNRLLKAQTVLLDVGQSAASRLKAIRSVEDLILSLIDWPEELKLTGRESKLQALSRDADWLRQAAVTLCLGVADAQDPDAFGSSSRDLLRSTLGGGAFGTLALGAQVKKPTPDAWSEYRVNDHSTDPELRYDTIHKAKGMEFPAVLVALPSTLRSTDGQTVLDDWENGVNTEPRRVLYVGASRAQKLLAFGAGPHAKRIAGLLACGGASATIV